MFWLLSVIKNGSDQEVLIHWTYSGEELRQRSNTPVFTSPLLPVVPQAD